MSRIGRSPIEIIKGVEVSVSPANVVTVKGPKGVLSQPIERDMTIEIKDNHVHVSRPTDQIRHKAAHGLSRALIHNMVVGVSHGFTKKLELVGVGFKASHQGNLLDLSIGYSHNVVVEIPEEVKIETETLKGKNPTITLTSADRQLLGQVAAKIRSLRKPEPYKGKGIKFEGEILRRKAGKAAGK